MPTTSPPAATGFSQAAFSALQGSWHGTGFDLTVTPAPGQPEQLTSSLGGSGMPTDHQITFNGVQAGSGSLKLTYDFSASPNTLTADTMGDGVVQATRVISSAGTQSQPSTSSLATPNGGSVHRPSMMEMGGNHDEKITAITWSSWGASSAQGVGSETTNTCVPNCAQGSPITIQVSLTLSQPQAGVFTSLTTTDGPTPNDPQGFPTTWNYPSLWPINAS